MTSKSDVENTLWHILDLMRGKLNSAESKMFAASFLTLKRLSDLDENNETDIYLPESAKWDEIKVASYDSIGENLNKAFKDLGEQYSSINRIFYDLDFDSEKIGDRFERNNMWNSCIEELSKLQLANEALDNPDVLTYALAFLVEFESKLQTRGNFDTPLQIAKLLIKILSPNNEMTIYDPFCNNGTSLLESAKYIEQNNGTINSSFLYGQVLNQDAYANCMLNLILYGYFDFQIELGDVIRNPKFIYESGEKEGDIIVFDRVLGVCPMEAKNWGDEFAETDPYKRFSYGLPPRTRGEFGYLQHMIASVKKNGMLVAVVPKGVLFRMGKSEAKIRELILRRDDLIEAVIGLPSKMFSQSAIESAIIIINKNKPSDRKNKVLFIDASNEFQKGRTHNTLSGVIGEKIIEVLNKFENKKGFCSVVSMEEIAKNKYSLDISQYVIKLKPDKEKEMIDINVALHALNKIQEQKNNVINDMRKCLEELENGGGV